MRIAVCGCGAVGSLAAVLLSHIEGVAFLLIDDDRVEGHNLATSAYDRRHVGRLKTFALESILAWNGAQSELFRGTLRGNGPLLRWGPDIVLDCFDNNESRELTRTPNTIHAGVGDVGTASVVWDHRWVSGNSLPRGQNPVCTHVNGAWILGMCAQFMAVSAMNFIECGERISFPLITKTGETITK